MATTDLVATSIIETTGFAGFTVSDIQTSNDVRATGGAKNDIIRIEIDDAPGDFATQNSVVLKVEARTSGPTTRNRQVQIDLTDSADNVLETFTTSVLTETDVLYTSSTFNRSDNETAINGYRVLITVLEGGGMADSESVEIDWVAIELDYTATVPETVNVDTASLTLAVNDAAIVDTTNVDTQTLTLTLNDTNVHETITSTLSTLTLTANDVDVKNLFLVNVDTASITFTAFDAQLNDTVNLDASDLVISAYNPSMVRFDFELDTLGTTTTFDTFDSSLANTLYVRYALQQGNVYRIGAFRVASDGTNVSYDDNYTEVGGTSNVVFTASMTGSVVNIEYHLTSTTATLQYYSEMPSYSATANFDTLGSETTFTTVDDDVIRLRYSLEQDSVLRTGVMRIVNDNTNVAFDEDLIESGDTTVDLKANVNGAITYTATTNTATFNYELIEFPLTSVSFDTLDTDTVFDTYVANETNAIHIEYELTEGGIIRVGTFRISSDGTNVSYDDDYVEVGGASTVALSADISGTDIRLIYHTSATAQFKYFAESLARQPNVPETIDVDTATLILTANDALIDTPEIVEIDLRTISITVNEATVEENIEVDTVNLALNAFSVNVVENIEVDLRAISITVNDITVEENIEVDTVNLTLNSLTVNVAEIIEVNTTSLTLTAFAANVAEVIEVDTASLTLTTNDVDTRLFVFVDATPITLTTFEVEATGEERIGIDTVALTLTEFAPNVIEVIEIDTQTLTLNANAVNVIETVEVDSSALTLTANAVAINERTHVEIELSTLELSANALTIQEGLNVDLASLTLTVLTPQVSIGQKLLIDVHTLHICPYIINVLTTFTKSNDSWNNVVEEEDGYNTIAPLSSSWDEVEENSDEWSQNSENNADWVNIIEC